MNAFIIISLIVVILLIYYLSAESSLDSEIINGWWTSPTDFNDKANLDYMFVNFETSGTKNMKVAGYIVAGDSEGLVYNTPIKMNLDSIKSEKQKGKYEITLNMTEKLPFPDKSTLILDRTNCSISIYKDDILYAYLQKT